MNKKEEILISELIGALKYWLVDREREISGKEDAKILNRVEEIFQYFLKERDELK